MARDYSDMAWLDLDEDIAELFGTEGDVIEALAVHVAQRQARCHLYDAERKAHTKFTKQCANLACGRTFATASVANVFCTSTCRAEATVIRRHARRQGYKPRACKKCGDVFAPGGPRLSACARCKDECLDARRVARNAAKRTARALARAGLKAAGAGGDYGKRACKRCGRSFVARWPLSSHCDLCPSETAATRVAARVTEGPEAGSLRPHG